jgi:LemA protein
MRQPAGPLILRLPGLLAPPGNVVFPAALRCFALPRCDTFRSSAVFPPGYGFAPAGKTSCRHGGRRMIPLIIIIVILAVIAFALIGFYNSLVQLRVRADNAWADIDVQLKRRYDLIPNLVETVKGYAAHEKGTFENVAKFRSVAMAASTPAEKSEAEGQLTYALRGLLAVAEAYPQLRASEQFQSLQGSLSGLEDAIQNARRYYNAVVRDLNTKIQTFPSNIVAGMFHVQQKQFFDITEPTQREPVAVKF